MEEVTKRSKTQILREIQETVDEFLQKKQLVESLLEEIDNLELKYYELQKEIKK
jgi:hypothetical protein